MKKWSDVKLEIDNVLGRNKMLENIKVYGLEESIVASGYPMSSKLMNELDYDLEVARLKWTKELPKRAYNLGNAKTGSGHDCFLKGITVQFDLTLSLLAQRQILRYHFIDIISSQSTMHRALRMNVNEQCNNYVWKDTKNALQELISYYNNIKPSNPNEQSTQQLREIELEILYNLPAGYELTARYTTNYLQLKTIYNQRKHHKLPEWKAFCNWLMILPHFKELTGCGLEKENKNA